MIISREKKFIFFACGKTGTTSLEKLLEPYHDAKELDLQIGYALYQMRYRHHRPFNPKHALPSLVKSFMEDEEWDSYFKFVFVRNPWDWLVACFCYNFKFLSQFLGKFELDHAEAIWHLMKLHNQSMTAENYFQHSFVYEEGKQIVDYVGRFETLQQDFDEICRRIGIPQQPVPHENKSSHVDYRKLYTPQTIDWVRDRYREDIGLFGYDFSTGLPATTLF